MSSQQIQAALSELNTPHPLSILTLADPILSSQTQPTSSTSETNPHHNLSELQTSLTPSSLQADLTHYKDLFSKLRFSYVEQVTKERFLKAIVANPPDLVDAAQNAELDEELKEAKTRLKAKKVVMEDMIRELENMARRLAQSYEIIQLQKTQLTALPSEISLLESHISSLLSTQQPPSADPELNLPLPATTALLQTREAELAALDAQIHELQNSRLPQRKREVAGMEAELGPLDARKRGVIEEAREARRRRGEGGVAVELEERGRWLRGVEAGLRSMLEV